MRPTAERNALETWLRRELGDGKVHREADLAARWRRGPGSKLSEEEAAAFLFDRLKALEAGMAIVRAPGTSDGWWRPN